MNVFRKNQCNVAIEFRSTGKLYKKIAGKIFRLPRKVKKRFKTKMRKRYGFDIKKLKFSYKRLNR